MIELITSGFWTSIQDLGRYGYRKAGIPVSGAMDRRAAMLANQIVGNTLDTAVMEITASGPNMLCRNSSFVVVTGGCDLAIGGERQPNATKCYVPAGSSLEFVPNGQGMRAYLAVRGGLDLPKVMGSYSQYTGITEANRLQKGDVLGLAREELRSDHRPLEMPASLKGPVLNAYPGPEWAQLEEKVQDKILKSEWTILPESNRMAYLTEARDGIKGFDIVTAAVQPGTVQLTPSGKLAILMRDAQTTGGYARIFQLDAPSVDYVAQRSSGQQIRFRLIGI